MSDHEGTPEWQAVLQGLQDLESDTAFIGTYHLFQDFCKAGFTEDQALRIIAYMFRPAGADGIEIVPTEE